MDPITAAIVVAAAAGVAAGAGDASKNDRRCDDALKLAQEKFGAESEVVKSAEGVVAKPDRLGKETLKEEVTAKADQDAELVAAAQH